MTDLKPVKYIELEMDLVPNNVHKLTMSGQAVGTSSGVSQEM